MASKLDDLGFKPSIANHDTWLKPACKADGTQYYEYVLMYIDDILTILERARKIMIQIQGLFKFKNNKIEEPTNYLGTRLQKKIINKQECWSMTSQNYVKAAIDNVETTIKDTRWKLPSQAKTPMTSNYVPEMNSSLELSDKDKTFFQEWIEILRWATEIGRMDILLKVSLLSQYQAAPHDRHLEQALYIFGYLKKKPKLSLYFDPLLFNIDYTAFWNKEGRFP